jgi:hypothetical protein
MRHDADRSQRNSRGAGDASPRDEHDIERDREELAQLIGELLARRWLRNQQGRPDVPQSLAEAD